MKKNLKKIYLISLILPLFFVTGCLYNTVIPKNIDSKQGSYSGTNSHSGIIDKELNKNGEVVSITFIQEKIDEYNALIEVYGKKFIPNLNRNDGLTRIPKVGWKMDGEHVVYFSQMLEWNRKIIK